MRLPPAIIVHGLPMAEAAIRVAQGNAWPMTLLSAPGAGAYAGVGWWRALVEQSGASAATPDILDCGSAPGRALEALRGGQKLLVLRARPDIWADIASRAEACGGRLLGEPPPALDLARRGAARQLQSWLDPSQAGAAAIPLGDMRRGIG